MTAETLLARLDGVRKTRPGAWMARCPGHPDKRASLSVLELPDGTILINDFGGCGATEVLSAIGLDFSALFPPKLEFAKGLRRPVLKEDAFTSIMHEATVVWLAACDMHKSKQIAEADYERLGEAITKLARIRGLAYGR